MYVFECMGFFSGERGLVMVTGWRGGGRGGGKYFKLIYEMYKFIDLSFFIFFFISFKCRGCQTGVVLNIYIN